MTIAERVRHFFGSSVHRQVIWLTGMVGAASAVLFVFFSTSALELAIGVSASLLVTSTAIVLLSNVVSRPLLALLDAAESMARGDLGRQADETVGSEIGGIARGLNAIARRLRELSRLADGQQALETRAAEQQRVLNEVQMSYDHILLVSELGQDIASSLNLEDILAKLYERINSMMDAAIFALGEYDEKEQRIHFRMVVEQSQRLPAYDILMNDRGSLAAWCIKNGKEVFLNNAPRDYARYVDSFGTAPSASSSTPKSVIFIPMFAKQRPIGVICVQSPHENAYTNYHVDMLKSLSLYTGAALDNARAYEELGHALKELRSAQNQLVQSEKMSSLGLLTAGIAHEINNPINFVSANVNPLRRDINDVLGIVRQYQGLDPAGNVAAQLAEIRAAADNLDLTYTLEEIHKLLDGIEEGANRTAEIVRGLRNFSRLDENEIKSADLHEGLDSTLTLLRNKYRDRITVVKHYGDIPKIECYPGQLNQVFMNILSNAVQAIADKGTITITTASAGDRVSVRIKDSGTGMPEDVRKKIFDPFFTTKDVGVGTGLGLSISYGIIEKHSGRIEVESAVGKGTEFIITLPVAQAKQAA